MNKSKFLKKSLAMLLALMLVVAMIPLSAAAAVQDDLEYINVNTHQVSVNDLAVEMSSSYLDEGENITLTTNDDLSAYHVELRAYKTGDSVEYQVVPQVGQTGSSFPVKDFVTVSSDKKTGTVKLAMVATKGNTTIADNSVLKEYTLNINFVDSSITTDLEVVPLTDGSFGTGVYNAYVDGDEIVVETARHNPTYTNEWTQSVQNRADPKITVKALDGATIASVNVGGASTAINKTQDEINADNGTVITVRSQDKQHDSDYKVVAKYVDALASFSTEVGDAEIAATIENKEYVNDSVPETITLTLPKSVLVAENGDEDISPELPIFYAVNGNVNAKAKAKVDVKIGTDNPVTVKNDGSVSVKMTNLGDKTSGAYVDLKGTVTVTRFGGFVQQYNLIVKLEDSTNTSIEYARVDATDATVDNEAGTITAVLPEKYNGVDTNRKASVITLYTENTVEKVTIGTVEATKITTGEPTDNDQIAWQFDANDKINTESPVTVSVYAEDGHFEQYTLTTSMATETNSASMTAFSVKDNKTKITYYGKQTGDTEFTIEVPYMTTSTKGWTVFATPGTNSKVVFDKDPQNPNDTQTDIVNGVTKAEEVGLADDKTANWTLPLSGITSKNIVAVNTADDDIYNTYTVKIELLPKKSADELTSLHFTSQISSNDTDKKVYRALNDENQFRAYINQLNDGTTTADNINLYVPSSLTSHYEDYDQNNEIEYQNIVTGFEVPEGAVAYWKYAEWEQGANWGLKKLTATTNDVDGVNPPTGTVIADGTQIVVLPEEIARQVDTATAPVASTGKQNVGVISKALIDQYGTVYAVDIHVEGYETDSTLESISVGDAPLNVVGHKITGELPWSYTVDANDIEEYSPGIYKFKSTATEKYMFGEYTMSKYAALRFGLPNNCFPLWNNGDDDLDGVKNNPAPDNCGYVFVRSSTTNDVTVYYYNGTLMAELPSVTVRAEDRLALKGDTDYDVSQTTYDFELTWAQPSNEAEISNFTLAGRTGTVTNTSETERTITVNVPYGTDLKGMIATFQHSLGSKVTINTPSGLDFVSGTTSLNYSTDVIVYVTSEDGRRQNRYTIKVVEGLSFEDVNEGDWFYDNVMDAAENGYVTGVGDGLFAPTKATTRAEFASMIAKAMGYTAEPDAPSAFPDVADNFWGKAAINFCAQNGIISGYSDGTFQPNKAITRQEAAAILNNAFDLAEKFGTSSDLFSDDAKISGWAETHVYAAKASGLMKGDAAGTFRPTDTIIRAEAASILMNAKYEGLIK